MDSMLIQHLTALSLNCMLMALDLTIFSLNRMLMPISLDSTLMEQIVSSLNSMLLALTLDLILDSMTTNMDLTLLVMNFLFMILLSGRGWIQYCGGLPPPNPLPGWR